MEVHHHPDLHHKKKRFKEYLLEFLMIFLAVTLGFIAENVREHISENSQAKELAKSLYKETYSDSIVAQQRIAGRLEKEQYLSYFVQYVRDSSLTNLSDQFYPAFTAMAVTTVSTIFEPKDGILEQLRNSGALRYFKSNRLQEEIGEIGVAISNLKARNAIESSFRESTIWPFSIRHYDYSWFEELVRLNKNSGDNVGVEKWFKGPNGLPAGKPQITKLNLFDRDDAQHIATSYLAIVRGTRLISYQEYAAANHQLLVTLREEYGLGGE
jgi:hypothetical protein